MSKAWERIAEARKPGVLQRLPYVLVNAYDLDDLHRQGLKPGVHVLEEAGRLLQLFDHLVLAVLGQERRCPLAEVFVRQKVAQADGPEQQLV